jgi:hypothetical protein
MGFVFIQYSKIGRNDTQNCRNMKMNDFVLKKNTINVRNNVLKLITEATYGGKFAIF